MKAIKRLKNIFDKKQKIGFFLLVIMMVIGGLFETVGISAVIPLISVVLSPDSIKSGYLKILYDILSPGDIVQFTIWIGLMFVLFYLVKTAYLMIMYRIQFGYIFSGQRELAKRLFTLYMKKPYKFFLDVNSSTIQRVVTISSNQTFSFVTALIQLLTQLITVIFITVFLFIVNWKMTLAVIIILSVILLVIKKLIEPATRRAGDVGKEMFALRVKWINQAFGGIKEVIIGNHQNYFIDKFSQTTLAYTETEKKTNLFNKIPPIIIEAVSVCGISIYILIILISGSDITSMIAILGAFGMSLIKLMPCAAGISTYINSLAYFSPSVEEIEETILSSEDEEVPFVDFKDIPLIKFEEKIELKDIFFKYENRDQTIFENAGMVIKKGQSVGIKGPSGAGKTTIVDILLGLLIPDSGKILIDDKEVSSQYLKGSVNVGYIPQNIFLIDDTIRRNVAFGLKDPDIDDEKVWCALEEAQMADYVRKLPEGLETVVGEHGVRFSGGQKQRIGIARALYHNPPILVFDEATSALDEDTERAVMSSIEGMHGRKTMIIIAHRLKTIEKCDVIYTVVDKKLLH